MTTMTRRILTTAAALGLAVFSAVPAVASTEQTPELKLSGDPHVTGSSPLTLKAKKIASGTLELVCWTFTFTGDLLDPGEGLTITPDNLDPGAGPGFENVGTEPTVTRTLCVDDPTFLPEIADGNSAEQFVVGASPGSSTFTVASVTMTLTYA
ncbi:hypothetical protein [Arthrobacter sp. ISL-5]|uniref:hypothetical protein n=1 Tax=Arthrobacter sp. ISL-5 TaxID=2819111 RepID=UPI001BE4FD24|nr:hypothetical protein [Arthrobacter sp. ISL-5]MBT2554280.1 hypothetical protein [Arthrobacter sp. ISL-5]